MVPRRVLMTADTIGGVWEYSVDLSRVLAAAGIEVTLATMGREPSPRQRWEAERIPFLTLHTSTFKLEWMCGADDDARACSRWLLDLENAVGPDIVHLNGFSHGCLPWSAPVLIVAHSCVLSWWEAVHAGQAPAEWNDYRSNTHLGLQLASAVAAPSRWMAGTVERLYGVGGVSAIPNGRDKGAGFYPEARKQPMVLTAGRLWDAGKNAAALDRASAMLPWPVYFAGPTSGPFGDAFVPRYGTALGALTAPELAAWMRQASIYALPAKYEPFGLSALEAALCGCALVLGDIPSLRENWEEAALFVDPADHRELADVLAQLIASPGSRSELARRAGERARQFTTGRMGAGYLALYRQLLELQRAPAARAAENA